MRIDFLHATKAAAVRVEVAVNDDPKALGCSDDARGLPYCRAVIEQDARGYADALGWIQLVDSSDAPDGFKIDPFEPLGEVTHPFCFFGLAPTLFDSPSRRARDDMTWTANAFLAGIRGDFEAFAILGFRWGFTIRDGEVTTVGPTELDASTAPRRSKPPIRDGGSCRGPSRGELRDGEAVVAAKGIAGDKTEFTVRYAGPTAESGHSRIFGGEEVVHQIGAHAGNTVVPVESGGTTRKMYYEHGGLVSFGVAAAEAMTGRQISAAEFESDGKAWIDYRGPPETFRNVPFSRVLRDKVPAGVFRGKTVVIGATSPSLQDQHATSTTGDSLMSGPEVQANAIWTAARGFPLASSATVVDLILILLLAAAPAAATLWLRPPPALAVALALGLAYVLVAQLLFDGGTVLPVVYPLLALIVSALGAVAANYLITSFERQRVHDTFARFVPEAVVADVLDRVDDGDLRFGGVRRECTVLFSDLRGFTSFAEELEPDRVIEVLNRYLEEMSDAIMDNGGTLVAYMGDGIMAVFGAPIEQEDHADRALAAAREMLRVRLPRFNEWMTAQRLGDGFAMGIGINSGTVMSGQVGSERRIEYTAIGDTTNTAARLEGMTKGSGHQVFVADSTKVARQGDAVELQPVGEHAVRGRTHTITVWTIA